MEVKEKTHRLFKGFYIGEINVAFTLCMNGKARVFCEHKIVSIFTDILALEVTGAGCIVPIYCFMPDHQHIIVSGVEKNFDVLKAITRYKQKTGFWMAKNNPEIKWQKDFYDYVIKKEEILAVQVKYILDNPVRKKLVASWEKYPFKGSIGCEMENVLNGII